MQTLEVELDSGVILRMRPLSPADKELLRVGMRRLSDRSKFFRFHTLVSELSDRQLDYLTDLDYHDHFAWGAAVEIDGEEVPVGVSRFVRDPERPERAEAAVTVSDEWQGKGAGSLLLEALADVAMDNGVTEFTALVLSENTEMLEIFERLGGEFEQDNGETHVIIPLPLPETRYRDSRLHRIMRETARIASDEADLDRDEVEH